MIPTPVSIKDERTRVPVEFIPEYRGMKVRDTINVFGKLLTVSSTNRRDKLTFTIRNTSVSKKEFGLFYHNDLLDKDKHPKTVKVFATRNGKRIKYADFLNSLFEASLENYYMRIESMDKHNLWGDFIERRSHFVYIDSRPSGRMVSIPIEMKSKYDAPPDRGFNPETTLKFSESGLIDIHKFMHLAFQVAPKSEMKVIFTAL